jgi:hypothetical protein
MTKFTATNVSKKLVADSSSDAFPVIPVDHTNTSECFLIATVRFGAVDSNVRGGQLLNTP